MKIYVDSESRCHAADDGSMRSVEDSFFDGKCAAFVEGYKLEEKDGLRHIYPVVDSRILAANGLELTLGGIGMQERTVLLKKA